eukprot:CAMPEP_0184490584 /NCGR_PEP_ID=MMETSP0113_2-20130426/18255_1 /TAXON_ID=91329 /ORGANISM="Norrisiella sphaerica, Strain BC52" /LENGTH=230 /DNA_ID=CAMNT_0026874529 /DNA_START=246 /DNA_END=938 /DNA_ORIENTATION=-
MTVLAMALGKYMVLGSTLDDSIGEAFDKVARLLGVTHVPGGKEVEKLAKRGNCSIIPSPLPHPLVNSRNPRLRNGCDMSFSGLKEHVRRLVESHVNTQAHDEKERALWRSSVAKAFQERAVDHVLQRTARAIDKASAVFGNLTYFVLAGGVASNTYLRDRMRRLADEKGLKVLVPPPKRCTDNAVMVAWAGFERLRLGLFEPPIESKNLTQAVEIRPRWPLGSHWDEQKV